MNHPPEYWKGVGLTIKGESRKAAAYITHSPSLGAAREEIIRKHLVEETPGRFAVQTGLIRATSGKTSRQCDVLVYEPGQAAPLYRIGHFVVVHSGIARLVVEVKSDLDQERFKQVLDVYDDMPNANVPTLGFGFDGVTMATFIEYLQAAVTGNRRGLPPEQVFLNWPIGFAVHEKNYFCLRPTLCSLRPAQYWCCCVDFASLKEDAEAAATAQFFNTYYRLLVGERIEDVQLKRWFNALHAPPGGKAWITPSGVVHDGDIPE